jgi:hypothetical protein
MRMTGESDEGHLSGNNQGTQDVLSLASYADHAALQIINRKQTRLSI